MIEQRGCKFIEKHREHALHSPYWWLKCLFWKNQDNSYLVNKYHDFLVWDMMKKPFITRLLEKILQPLIGKSTVIYFEKNQNLVLKSLSELNHLLEYITESQDEWGGIPSEKDKILDFERTRIEERPWIFK